MKKQQVWESKAYISKAHQGSLDMQHPAMQELIRLSEKAENVLDIGCGDGTRLKQIVSGNNGVGIDISEVAIRNAKNKNRNLKFVIGDLNSLPFKENSFDLVYSAYVIEHVWEPERMIKEAVRVLKSKGFLLIVAPNYGAPNRSSPPNKNNRFLKFIVGFSNDIVSLFKKSSGPSFTKVNPIADKNYEMDYDTTVEPYLRSLKDYIQSLNMKIVKSSSLWSEELDNAKFHQRLFKFFSQLGLFPFKYWGPHLMLIAQKE